MILIGIQDYLPVWFHRFDDKTDRIRWPVRDDVANLELLEFGHDVIGARPVFWLFILRRHWLEQIFEQEFADLRIGIPAAAMISDLEQPGPDG